MQISNQPKEGSSSVCLGCAQWNLKESAGQRIYTKQQSSRTVYGSAVLTVRAAFVSRALLCRHFWSPKPPFLSPESPYSLRRDPDESQSTINLAFTFEVGLKLDWMPGQAQAAAACAQEGQPSLLPDLPGNQPFRLCLNRSRNLPRPGIQYSGYMFS